MAIFWHSNGNFPEGQAPSLGLTVLEDRITQHSSWVNAFITLYWWDGNGDQINVIILWEKVRWEMKYDGENLQLLEIFEIKHKTTYIVNTRLSDLYLYLCRLKFSMDKLAFIRYKQGYIHKIWDISFYSNNVNNIVFILFICTLLNFR